MEEKKLSARAAKKILLERMQKEKERGRMRRAKLKDENIKNVIVHRHADEVAEMKSKGLVPAAVIWAKPGLRLGSKYIDSSGRECTILAFDETEPATF